MTSIVTRQENGETFLEFLPQIMDLLSHGTYNVTTSLVGNNEESTILGINYSLLKIGILNKSSTWNIRLIGDENSSPNTVVYRPSHSEIDGPVDVYMIIKDDRLIPSEGDLEPITVITDDRITDPAEPLVLNVSGSAMYHFSYTPGVRWKLVEKKRISGGS